MAKPKLADMTIEQLEAQQAAVLTSYEATVAVAKKAEQARNREREKLRKIQLEIESRREVTLENMLEVYLPSGENSVGYKWLQDRTWKGEWKDSGLAFQGSYWPETNQRVLSIRLERDAGDEKLTGLEALLAQVMPSVKAGMYDEKRGNLKLMSKGSSVPLKDLKVLEISDAGLSQYANWQIAQLPSGTEWAIFDSYNAKYDWGRARIVGTLRECLEEIRQYLNCTSREDSDEEE